MASRCIPAPSGRMPPRGSIVSGLKKTYLFAGYASMVASTLSCSMAA
jgi:hypothetical protein